MTAHSFEKESLLKALNNINQFEVICLLESYLNSSVASDNDKLKIKYHNLHRADHPDNVKRVGVRAYIRESLPIRCLRIHI